MHGCLLFQNALIVVTYRDFPSSIIFYNISEDNVYVTLRNELNMCHYYQGSLLCFNKTRKLTMSKVPYTKHFIKSGWSIVYIDWSQVKLFQTMLNFVL